MISEGRVFTFFMLILVTAIIAWYLKKGSDGWVPNIRSIPGLNAIEECVGRATEMGRPVHYTMGIGALNSAEGAQMFAGLEILGVVARTIARYGSNLIVTICKPQILPLAEEVVRQAYLAEGATELYNPDTVRYLSDTQFAYAAGALGIMFREKVAANIMIGAFWAESLVMAETGNRVGAIQIAGTARLTQIPFFVATCDYVLIGEELFAASAIASKNPVKLGSIAGQDIGKAVAVAMILVGTLMETVGVDSLTTLLSK